MIKPALEQDPRVCWRKSFGDDVCAFVCVACNPAGLPIHDATRSNYTDIAQLLKVRVHVTLTTCKSEVLT